MSDQPERLVDKLVGACFAVLFGALALYGAVYVVDRVWLQLAIGAAVLAAIALFLLWWRSRWRRW